MSSSWKPLQAFEEKLNVSKLTLKGRRKRSLPLLCVSVVGDREDSKD